MPDSRPNVLLITTDQQRFDTIAELGNRVIFTPHLDWLARQGVAFTRAYADCPVCVPSRATIMTGLHAWRHGGLRNGGDSIGDRPTLPALLGRAGYQTRACGKMHFQPARARYGFDHTEILPDYYRFMRRHQPQHGPKDHGLGENEMTPALATVPEGLSVTRWVVERSINFLETRDPRQPFFLWTSFSKPHPPFDPPASYWRIYDGVPMPPPVYGDWSRDVEAVPRGLMQSTWATNNLDRLSPAQLAATRRAYYACISQIDYNLGLLFGRLRELRLLDRTWIVFTSDHGEMLGDHHMGGKSVFLEGSAHVPLIIRPPEGASLPRGERCDAISCLADLLPTFAGIAGAEAPEACDGIDLLALQRGDAQRDQLVAAGPQDRYHMLLRGRHKDCFTAAGGHDLLFDLASDPYEQRNLADDPVHAALLSTLKADLARHLAARGHPAAGDGTLVSTGEAKPRREVQAREAWPGFHSTADSDCDTLH